MAHSMGGLDCRHLITHVQPSDYTPLSLTTISTPHRGSPFMDWCAVCSRILSLFCSAFTLPVGKYRSRKAAPERTVQQGDRGSAAARAR